MNIRTFKGSADDMDAAIEEAETAAQLLLRSIGPDELISMQAQSIVDRWHEDTSDGRIGRGVHWCFHIITIIYR